MRASMVPTNLPIDYHMWSYIIINIMFALFIIILVQYLWDYFKNTYTDKITKDLAEFQTQKYKDMFLTIQNNPTDSLVVSEPKTFLSNSEKEWMVAELSKCI
jgi:hypothetical protein